jgi:hypothetical protein
VGLLTGRTLLLQFLIPLRSVAISSALRDNISTTRLVMSDSQETYMFASSCKNVHKGNIVPRSMVLGSGGARKD